MNYSDSPILGITTKEHPELKAGIFVKEATNPKGMHLAMSHWVMTTQGEIYYESNFLKQHIENGYIKKRDE